jgi:hypothetical protein
LLQLNDYVRAVRFHLINASLKAMTPLAKLTGVDGGDAHTRKPKQTDDTLVSGIDGVRFKESISVRIVTKVVSLAVLSDGIWLPTFNGSDIFFGASRGSANPI